jgi:UDP-glucose 4-epimerase
MRRNIGIEGIRFTGRVGDPTSFRCVYFYHQEGRELAVLVTGGLGYVGSHSAKMLIERGEDVVYYDSLIYGHKAAALGGEVVIGDIGDVDKLRETFSKYKIDAVMHFAAFAAVGESVADPQTYYQNNIG